MKTKLVVANWKMNPTTPKEAKRIFEATQKEARRVKSVETVVCPPTAFLADLAKARRGTSVGLGVQDVFYTDAGAFTGQTSPQMASAYKATYAIIGHSERRMLGETNEFVGRKARYAIEEGITAIVCVGESTRAEDGAYYLFVREELEAVFAGLGRSELKRLVIAYEPIWAIGKSAAEAMQSRELHEMVLFIKKLLIERFGRKPASTVRVLYGGSVKADNAEEIMREGGVDGLLVGSASLNPKEFVKIISASVFV
jgi:triosephosphate isomerase